MLDYPSARAVAMVVQTGSFEAAARELSVTPSAISQRVKQLEERLGAVLIERGTPCRATEKGEWLCRHIEHVGMLEQELREQLPGLADPEAPQQRVTLNIATNADSLGTWFLKAISPFAQKTDYLTAIAIDDQDYTAEWLQRGRVLAAVTSLKKPVQGCQVTPLGSLRYHATASPAYIKRHFPDGVTLKALAEAPGLIFSQKDRLQQQLDPPDTRAQHQLSHPLAAFHPGLCRCLLDRHGLGHESLPIGERASGVRPSGRTGSRRRA